MTRVVPAKIRADLAADTELPWNTLLKLPVYRLGVSYNS